MDNPKIATKNFTFSEVSDILERLDSCTNYKIYTKRGVIHGNISKNGQHYPKIHTNFTARLKRIPEGMIIVKIPWAICIFADKRVNKYEKFIIWSHSKKAEYMHILSHSGEPRLEGPWEIQNLSDMNIIKEAQTTFHGQKEPKFFYYLSYK